MITKINFSNGESIEITRKTIIKAWIGLDKDVNQEQIYYAKMIFEGSNYDGSPIGSTEPETSLQGLFSHSDWFSIQGHPEKIYKTTAIVSIETD